MGPGDIVANRFRLERQLGAGGMGAVFAATHLVTHKNVALKFLHKKNDDADARRRVLREARAACAVQHPNVCTVHDVVEDSDGTPILVMDLLRGESLAEKLARERTLSPADAIAVITPVLSALVVAHSVGIVHRDLKPDNIFLVDGLTATPRVLDFGVAKLSGKEAATKETNRLTETGAMIGTPHYMSPEQAFGESDVDSRADLWSAGAVLYECLSGFTPADGQNLGQILKVLASGKIVPLLDRAPSLPPQLAAIIDGMLKIERDERTASAAIVLEQLTAIGPQSAAIAPLGAQAVPAGTPQRPQSVPSIGGAARDATLIDPSPPRKRSRAPWIAGIAATLVLASAATVTGIRFKSQANANQQAAAAHQTSESAVVVAAAAAAAAPTPTQTAADPPPTPAETAPIPATSAFVKKKNANVAAGGAVPKKVVANAAPSAKTGGTTGSPLINDPTF